MLYCIMSFFTRELILRVGYVELLIHMGSCMNYFPLADTVAVCGYFLYRIHK